MLGPLNRVYHKTKRLGKNQPWLLPFIAFVLLFFCLVVYDLIGILVFPSFAKTSCRAETILVMGAAQYNGAPSPAFQRRLDKALELFNENCGKRVLVTGGKRYSDAYTEGLAGVRYLASKGIPASSLQSEEKSQTSYENLLFSRALLPDKRVTIVTDDRHSYRSHYLATRLGYSAELAPVFAPHDRLQYAFSELAKLTAYHLGMMR
jgi:uncharacterized SAM-binding protein YcdF (DUF218 family)